MSNGALLAYRQHVSENMQKDYAAETILVLLDEIIYWRRKFGDMDPDPSKSRKVGHS
jgi:hypothetical protein